MDITSETIFPEKVEDAVVADNVEEVEAETVDTEPVETEAAETSEVEAKPEEVEPEESSTPKDDGVQGRIDEITKLRRDAERDRDYWRNVAQQQRPATAPVEPGKTLADFEYDEGKYAEYVTAQASEKAMADTGKIVQQEKYARAQADFSSREADFAKGVDDYHTAISNESLRFSADMAEATLTAEKGPELRYYLAKNPDVSARLASMAPYDMAIELGRIEATKLVKAKAPSVTQVPKPVPKIAATDSKTGVRIDDPKISDAQFRKLREKQIANR